LKLHGVVVQIQILNEFVAGCPSFRRFRSPDSWVSAGAVLRGRPYRGHLVDAVVLDSRVAADVAPDLRVVFGEILIRRCS
jgi:hypothetical protein